MKKPSDNKHTMKKDLLFVGLDVHAQSITVAVVGSDRNQPRLYGSIPNDLHAMERMLTKLKKTHPGGKASGTRG